MAICLNPDQDDFRGYPPESPWTYTKTEQFQRNDCGSGQTGSWVEYSKTYSSDLSEEDLQQKIANDWNTYNSAGQANANANGTCSTSCQAASYRPSYSFFAMSTTQAWLNGITNTGVLTPYTKSTVLSSADLPNHTTLNNINKGLFWKTPFPHNSSSVGYQVYIDSESIFINKRTFTSGNACTTPTTYTVGDVKNPEGCWVEDFYVIGNDKLIILIGYNQASGIKSFDIWYWESGLGILAYVVERPKNYKYSASTGSIAYNGSTAYYMLAFHSRNNSDRVLSALFKTEFGSGNIWNASSKISNWSYSNQGVRVSSGGHAGSKVFFIYEEGGSMKTQNVIGTVSDAPNSMYRKGGWSYMRDPYSTNDCYFGNITYLGSGIYNRLVRYNASTNAWTVINNN